jgi:hypothetical protein
VEENLAIAKANGASSLIRLYKALGGGWPSMENASAIEGSNDEGEGQMDGGGT